MDLKIGEKVDFKDDSSETLEVTTQNNWKYERNGFNSLKGRK